MGLNYLCRGLFEQKSRHWEMHSALLGLSHPPPASSLEGGAGRTQVAGRTDTAHGIGPNFDSESIPVLALEGSVTLGWQAHLEPWLW